MNIVTFIFKILFSILILGIIIGVVFFSNKEVPILRKKLSKTLQNQKTIQTSLKEQEHINKQLKEENMKLSIELSKYKSTPLPMFKIEDLKNRKLILTRIFSVKSGNCFDVNGCMSCFFCKVQINNDANAFLLYKTNRMFKINEKIEIYDKMGHSLNLLTRKDAKLLLEWEKQKPHLLISLPNY